MIKNALTFQIMVVVDLSRMEGKKETARKWLPDELPYFYYIYVMSTLARKL